jgi:hypothetical protein
MTPAELDELSLGLADGVMKIRRLNREIDDIKDDAKRRIKTRQEQIEQLEDETEEQARKREAGTEDREVRCWRAVEGDEIAYYDPGTGEELHRHRARPGEQQGLFGGTPTGKAPQYQGPMSVATAVWLLGLPWPPEPEPVTNWPWCELSWHPLVQAEQLRTRALSAYIDPKGVHEPDALQASPEERRRYEPDPRVPTPRAARSLRAVGPCPLPSRANMRGHWSEEHKLVKAQHEAVEALLVDWCHGHNADPEWHWVDGKGSRPRLPKGVPCPAPLLVTMTRIPRKGGRLLDSGGGGNMDQMAKAVRDKVAAMLGAPNDAVDWIEWRVDQRKRRPADPENTKTKTELLELTIEARRGDVSHERRGVPATGR